MASWTADEVETKDLFFLQCFFMFLYLISGKQPSAFPPFDGEI